MCSAALEPLKLRASLPPWPSTVSLPSPGSHWKRSSPAPSSAVSAPMLPSARSSPAPPSSRSAPSPPRSVSSPAPPSSVRWVSVPMPFWPVIVSAPARPRDDEVLDRGVVDQARGGREDRDRRRRCARCRWCRRRWCRRRWWCRRPSPPSTVDGRGPGEVDAGADGVGAAEGGDGDVVERRLAAGHRGPASTGADTTSVPASELTATSSAASVPLAMTVSAEPSPLPSKPLRSTLAVSRSVPAEVVDGDGVGAAERADVQALDAVEVHGDRRRCRG